jgi:hypothetical protein
LAQARAHLPSKHEAPSSNPSTGKKNNKQTGLWWLMPVILVNWEAEIRRIEF